MDKKLILLLLAVGMSLSVSSVNAGLYTFSQVGFEEGAYVTGSFEGTDLNDDGVISFGSLAPAQELTAFSLSFSGNTIASAFTHGLSDITFFGYGLDTNPETLGDDLAEGLATRWFNATDYTYVSGLAPNAQYGGGIVNWASGLDTNSDHLISVNAVPVPGAIWLFGSALAGFLSMKRRKA